MADAVAIIRQLAVDVVVNAQLREGIKMKTLTPPRKTVKWHQRTVTVKYGDILAVLTWVAGLLLLAWVITGSME